MKAARFNKLAYKTKVCVISKRFQRPLKWITNDWVCRSTAKEIVVWRKLYSDPTQDGNQVWQIITERLPSLLVRSSEGNSVPQQVSWYLIQKISL